MPEVIEQDRPYLTTPQAAQRSGLSPSYLAHLLRSRKLEGFRLAREWFIYIDSLDSFLAHPRKPGPKGPTGPKRQRQGLKPNPPNRQG